MIAAVCKISRKIIVRKINFLKVDAGVIYFFLLVRKQFYYIYYILAKLHCSKSKSEKFFLFFINF